MERLSPKKENVIHMSHENPPAESLASNGGGIRSKGHTATFNSVYMHEAAHHGLPLELHELVCGITPTKGASNVKERMVIRLSSIAPEG